MDRAQTTFITLQNAWMNRNLEPARIYLSDGIYQRWKSRSTRCSPSANATSWRTS